MQLLLFKHIGSIPSRHFTWFKQANAGTYPFKTEFYYLKNALLDRHGIPDGKDLQTIHQVCNSCHKGIWNYRRWNADVCWYCHGTGIYRIKNVILQRFILNDTLFHKPDGLDENAPVRETFDDPDCTQETYCAEVATWSKENGYKNHHSGIIKHPHTPVNIASQAALKLLFHYRPNTARWLHREHCSGVCTLRDWIYQYHGSPGLWFYGLRDQDVPF